jgi:hypothetical protein
MRPVPKPKPTLDLSKGSVLHIEDFKAFGFAAKDKYIYVIGHQDAATVLAFVLSSQRKWAEHPFLGRENVNIPKGTLPTLPSESWIQCFHQVHELSVAELQARFSELGVKHKGHLPPEFLAKVRNVVECSDVLKQYEIQDCLDAIDSDKSKLE